MSLLLNLINYSSSLQNDARLSLNKTDDRSKSLIQENGKQEGIQRNKIGSKSLSKLLGQKPIPSIDPKSRILHRISHILSIKCKKHYYGLFVVLQTLKKKQLYMSRQGQLVQSTKKLKSSIENQNKCTEVQEKCQKYKHNQDFNAFQIELKKAHTVEIKKANEINQEDTKQPNNKKIQSKKMQESVSSRIQLYKVRQAAIEPSKQQKTEQLGQHQRKIKSVDKLGKLLQQMQKIIFFKYYENHFKFDFFNLIKTNYLYQDRLKQITGKMQIILTKSYSVLFFKNIKKHSQYAFKVQILFSLLENIKKRFQSQYSAKKIPYFEEKNTRLGFKQEAFQKIKLLMRLQNAYSKKSLQNQLQNQAFYHKNININQFNNKNTGIAILEVDAHRQSTSFEKQSLIKIDEKYKQKVLFKQNDLAQLYQLNDENKCSLKANLGLRTIQQQISEQQIRKFQKHKNTMLKSFKILSLIEEDPIFPKTAHKADKNSMFCKKLPKNYLIISLADQSRKFHQIQARSSIQNSFSLNQNNYRTPNKFKQSRVVQCRGAYQSFKKANYSEDQKLQNLQISQISAISLLKSQKSNGTLLNENKLSFSVFGGQAVNFKNSLVSQRQSLSSQQNYFMKKSYKYNQQQQFNYPKKNINEFFSTGKKILPFQQLVENCMKKERSLNDFNKNVSIHSTFNLVKIHQNNFLTRPCSKQKQKRVAQKQQISNFFNKSVGLIASESVFPTRDNSFNKESQLKQKHQNRQKRSLVQRSQVKQKGFIKLMNKK